MLVQTGRFDLSWSGGILHGWGLEAEIAQLQCWFFGFPLSKEIMKVVFMV